MHKRVSYTVSDTDRLKYPDIGAGYLCGPTDEITDYHEPSIGCIKKTMGLHCHNKYCPWHGPHERHRQATTKDDYDTSACDSYHLTLPFNCRLAYPQYRAVWTRFLEDIRAIFGNIPLRYNTEFVNSVPHIHAVIRLGLGSDQEQVGRHVRDCWKAALTSCPVTRQYPNMVGAWNKANPPRVHVKLMDATLADARYVVGYFFKSGRYDIRNELVLHDGEYHHVTNDKRLIAEAIRVAKPKGWRKICHAYRWSSLTMLNLTTVAHCPSASPVTLKASKSVAQPKVTIALITFTTPLKLNHHGRLTISVAALGPSPLNKGINEEWSECNLSNRCPKPARNPLSYNDTS